MPGSWEVLAQRQQRLLLGIICPPDLEITLDFALLKRYLRLPPGSDYMRVVGLPFGPARNQIARVALENSYHLAFWDADLRVEPDAFLQLFATGLDLVSGLYYQRFHPYLPVAFNLGYDEKGTPIRVPVRGWQPGDTFPCTFIPTGLTIYRQRLLSALFSRYPRPFEWGVDVAPIPVEEGRLSPFSEDFNASIRSQSLGFQGYVNSKVVGFHEVLAVVGPKWVVPWPSSDPLHGLVGVSPPEAG